MAEFGAAFKQAADLLAEIKGNATTRNRFAKQTLTALERAAALVPELPANRRAQARFFVGVRKVQVYDSLGTPMAYAKAAELGRLARKTAIAEQGYRTYYRTHLLVLLAKALDEPTFLALLREPLANGYESDGDYLHSDKSRADVDKARKQGSGGFVTLGLQLRLLRAWIDLDTQPARAVRDLQELGMSLSKKVASERAIRDECFSRLAWHFIQLRDYDRAKVYLAEVPPRESRYPLAVIDYKTEEFAYCEQQAQKLYEEEKSSSYAQLLAHSLERQGQLALAGGDEAAAHARFRKALSYYAEALSIDKTDPELRMAVRNGEGDCLVGLGAFDKAALKYREVLDGLSDAKGWLGRAERAETLKDLGRLLEKRGDAKAALTRFGESLDEVERIRQDIPLDALGIAWLEPGWTEAVDGYLRLAARGETDALQALTMVDRMKSRGLLDWMTRPPDATGLDTYRSKLRQLAQARSAADIRRLRLELEQLRVGGDREQAAPLRAAQIAALAKARPETLFLSYWTGQTIDDRRMWVIAARGDAIRIHDLGSHTEGMERYLAARAQVHEVVPDSDPWDALDAASAFFLPMREAIAAAANVVIVADTAIGDLPFEALRIDGTPLGARKPVYRSPSLAVLHRLLGRVTESGSTVIFDSAEPQSGARELHGLSRLEFSAEEGDVVARAWPEHVRRQHSAANFEQLRRLLTAQRFRVLHVNCHAVNDPRTPSESILMLSDGAVDMRALAALPMRGSLVVFSACHSVGTDRRGGEGVSGLLWGPIAAGAKSVVASHWAMNQQATKDLMGQFHHHLAKGEDAGEAMRRARSTLAAAKNYAHPSYWAGFGVFAVPVERVVEDPVAGALDLPWLWIGGGVLLLGAAVFLLRRGGASANVSA